MRKGTPFFAGRSFTAADRQPIPVVRQPDAISEVFAKTRETIAEIESARDCWSVAQAANCRRAS